ncbi:MAG: metallophosphoesterase [Oscillospiraceae bacterium]|nr:metallophosphoesterase [Oscillospiraceae bacterium]
MSLYVLADLHLSININKPMDIFQGWENYTQKIKTNFEKLLTDDDTIVLVGDTCWGMSLEESLPSFEFLNNLPGNKIILKGNHDYWWSTKTKMMDFFSKHNLLKLNILNNNYYVVDNICICGTRGWMFENGEKENIKLINREAQRLEISIQSCLHLGLPIFVFLHYPPIYSNQTSSDILNILKKYKIKKCFYGHLHGKANKNSVNGFVDDIYYQLVSGDYLNFTPIKIS